MQGLGHQQQQQQQQQVATMMKMVWGTTGRWGLVVGL
jgi:hypothetical protein